MQLGCTSERGRRRRTDTERPPEVAERTDGGDAREDDGAWRALQVRPAGAAPPCRLAPAGGSAQRRGDPGTPCHGSLPSTRPTKNATRTDATQRAPRSARRFPSSIGAQRSRRPSTRYASGRLREGAGSTGMGAPRKTRVVLPVFVGGTILFECLRLFKRTAVFVTVDEGGTGRDGSLTA